jgi:hypothetical protein
VGNLVALFNPDVMIFGGLVREVFSLVKGQVERALAASGCHRRGRTCASWNRARAPTRRCSALPNWRSPPAGRPCPGPRRGAPPVDRGYGFRPGFAPSRARSVIYSDLPAHTPDSTGNSPESGVKIM